MVMAMRTPVVRWLVWTAASLAVAGTVAGGTMLLERSFIYFPSRDPMSYRAGAAAAAAAGVSVEDCEITTADGVRLHAWWCRPSTPSRAVMLMFHGNAGNLADRADMMVDFARLSAEVLMVDYRGYGRSEGRPSERGLRADASAAWSYLTEVREVPPQRVVLYGESLGGAVAVDLASRSEPSGLVVQSSFTSIPDIAGVHMPLIPRILIRTQMDSAAAIVRVRCPVLVIHSPDDEIVPYGMGRRLFELAPGPKRWLEVPGAGHNETWSMGGRGLLAALQEFLVSCVGEAPDS